MCGIAGIVAYEKAERAPTGAELGAMIARLSHRGPDGLNIRIDGLVGLAHARLSIIDLVSGQQPIHNETRTVWVVLNGEIFNYIELRARLRQRGHYFYTESDTEVIVHLYEEYGDAFVDHLNGQFAIALHDLAGNRVLLVRDRVGIRPLFYTLTNGRLIFGSEIKALFALPEVRREIDVGSLVETFSLWSTNAPRSSFVGVHQLPPASMLTIDLDSNRAQRSQRLKTNTYWQWEYPIRKVEHPSSVCDENELASELRDLLSDSVKLQQRADVPVGAYLSGGLDSSSVISLVRNNFSNPLRTFSVSFDDAEFDERKYQREAVEYFGSEHSEIRVSRADIGMAFPRTVWHAEAPLVRTAATPLMLLSGHVRDAGFKTVLTGEGADELFAGYDLFREAAVRRFINRGPQGSWRVQLLERLYPYLAHSPMRGAQMAQHYFSAGTVAADDPLYAHDSRIRASRRTLMFLRPEVRAQIDVPTASNALYDRLPAHFSQWRPLEREQYVEATTLLPGYLLSAQGDRVAMAHSIEGRMPFLDHRLIEFANRLPPRLKLRTLNEKYLLKKAMRGRIPDSIFRRTKQPYRSPDSVSFFENGKPLNWVAELLSATNLNRSALFDAQPVAQLMRKCAAGRTIGFGDNIAFVGILSTLLLYDQFVRDAGAPIG